MPEYRKLKGDTPGIEWFTTPESMAQVAVDAQRILKTDAAILFADLLPVMIPMGLELDYLPGTGPVFHNPVRSSTAVDCLRPEEAATQLTYVADAIGITRQELPGDIPLIGFAGAPFTLASYAIEGGGSKNHLYLKCFMHQESAAWSRLMQKLVRVITDYVQLQIDAGVQAIQIFDSWVGCLSLEDFEQFVMPHTTQLFDAICGRVPVIYFGTGNSHLVDSMYKTGPNLMALDWRQPLMPTWNRLGCSSIQGNLDPSLLFADWPVIEKKIAALLGEVGGKPGHIFNLGHGILPQTPVDNVRRLVEYVQGYTPSSAG